MPNSKAVFTCLVLKSVCWEHRIVEPEDERFCRLRSQASLGLAKPGQSHADRIAEEETWIDGHLHGTAVNLTTSRRWRVFRRGFRRRRCIQANMPDSSGNAASSWPGCYGILGGGQGESADAMLLRGARTVAEEEEVGGDDPE